MAFADRSEPYEMPWLARKGPNLFKGTKAMFSIVKIIITKLQLTSLHAVFLTSEKSASK